MQLVMKVGGLQPADIFRRGEMIVTCCCT